MPAAWGELATEDQRPWTQWSFYNNAGRGLSSRLQWAQNYLSSKCDTAKLSFTDRFVAPLAISYSFLSLLYLIFILNYHGARIMSNKLNSYCYCWHEIHRESEYRIVFKVGDFVTVRNGRLARLDGVFLYQLSRGQNRLFARVTLVEDFRSSQIDTVLGASSLQAIGFYWYH